MKRILRNPKYSKESFKTFKRRQIMKEFQKQKTTTAKQKKERKINNGRILRNGK